MHFWSKRSTLNARLLALLSVAGAATHLASCALPPTAEKIHPNNSELTSNVEGWHKRDPRVQVGLKYLDESLTDTAMVGNPQTRAHRWRLHWDPGNCTAARGNSVEIMPGLLEFNRLNAYWLSWLSVQSYRRSDDAREHLARVGLTNVDFIDDVKSGFQAFVASTDSFVVASFAGTSDLADYLTDLTFASRSETFPGIPGRVHIGFLNVMNRSWPVLLDLIKKHYTTGKSILLTGHSLGGAEAVISATRLEKLGFPIDSLYIYSVPRIGDDEYARHVSATFPNRIWRFTNNEDLVPRLPPPAVAAPAFSRVFPADTQEAVQAVFETLQYSHVGKLLVQDGKGGLSEPRSFDESEDVGYWQQVLARTQGRSVPQAVFANWRMIFDHIPFASHCQLNPPKGTPFAQFTDFIE